MVQHGAKKSEYEERDSLGLIGKSSPVFKGIAQIAGVFNNQRFEIPNDGSSIVVDSSYVAKAREYARLYEKRTGRRVRLFEFIVGKNGRYRRIGLENLPRPVSEPSGDTDTLPRPASVS